MADTSPNDVAQIKYLVGSVPILFSIAVMYVFCSSLIVGLTDTFVQAVWDIYCPGVFLLVYLRERCYRAEGPGHKSSVRLKPHVGKCGH